MGPCDSVAFFSKSIKMGRRWGLQVGHLEKWVGPKKYITNNVEHLKAKKKGGLVTAKVGAVQICLLKVEKATRIKNWSLLELQVDVNL